ncbi:MAG: aspartate--tRNA ligase [SAR202 cluster bacterium]|nr:aspartate--tRNA ligase [SAR202 cluster bacterium]|tara:strand:- start:2 stop:1801 length:1800 start_codon:yes stop_codon:yes gene_type:complete
MLKSHTCGELRSQDAEETVSIAGWVHRRRDHGNLIFIDLRDRWGIVQVVINPEITPDAHKTAEAIRNEWVIQIEGKVVLRQPGTENPRIETGEIEIQAASVSILNPSNTPPFYINDEKSEEVDELLRLQYRYLDMRRPSMTQNLELRHKVIKFMRDYLDAEGFLEVETPILLKSTPEGARDYIVPSRLSPGSVYALPQSPQQLKQLLMVGGIEKYFQIARCFRDEDARSDRQPEFTQLDLEMSFVTENDVLDLTEKLFTNLIKKVTPDKKIIEPFPRLTFKEAMLRFGSDKPDLRFGMEIQELSSIAKQSNVGILKSAVEDGGVVRGINAVGCADYSRRQIDELVELARSQGAQGLVAINLIGDDDKVSLSGIRSSIARALTEEDLEAIAGHFDAKNGDLILIVAGAESVVAPALGVIRQEMGLKMKLAPEDLLALGFITEMPLFDWNEEENRWDSVHHPFTAPIESDISKVSTNPGEIMSRSYDMVCNGYEIASGSIRIHQKELQLEIFQALGYTKDEIENQFGHLLNAFEFGAPPHGGIAPGVDRFVMLLANEETIREVIPFPKTQAGVDPLTGAPTPAEPNQLTELGLEIANNPPK